MKKLGVVVFFFLLYSVSFGQSRYSIGAQGGVSMLRTSSISLGNEFPSFSPKGTPSGQGQVYVKYSMKRGWFGTVGIGVMHLGMSSTLSGIQGASQSLGGQTLNPQLSTSFGKAFLFGKGKWGSYISAGISMTILALSGERIYSLVSDPGIPFQGVLIRDDQNSVNEILAHDMRVFYTRKDKIWHIRPEVGVFRQFGNSRVFASCIYGLGFSEGLYTVSYNSISYKGERYSEMHGASGSFVSLQFGYEISF